MTSLKNDRALAEFGQNLILKLAVPVIAQGYSNLVRDLCGNASLARQVREQGVDMILSGDSVTIAALRKNNRELVTSAEKEAERLMTQAVREAFPDHAIIGEELGFTPGSDTRWVFDPVDGTSAMIKTAMMEAFGLSPEHPAPSFGITVALTEGNEAVLGIVTELEQKDGTLHAPHTWIGEKNKVTLCNGQKIFLPSAPEKLADAIVSCTAPQVMFNTPQKWSGWQALAEATRSQVSGQNCIGFMQLLQDSGINIAYESDLAYHDAAALVPILTGTGIKVSDNTGKALRFPESAITQEFNILAAQPVLHSQALAHIRKGIPSDRNTFAKRDTLQKGYAEKFPTK